MKKKLKGTLYASSMCGLFRLILEDPIDVNSSLEIYDLSSMKVKLNFISIQSLLGSAGSIYSTNAMVVPHD